MADQIQRLKDKIARKMSYLLKIATHFKNESLANRLEQIDKEIKEIRLSSESGKIVFFLKCKNNKLRHFKKNTENEHFSKYDSVSASMLKLKFKGIDSIGLFEECFGNVRFLNFQFSTLKSSFLFFEILNIG